MKNLKKLTSLILTVLMLAGCLIFATGCDNADENTITIYTALEVESIEDALKLFNAAHPDIKVEIVRDSTGIITSRIIMESANPVADLVWGTAASSMLILDEMGLLEPYAPAGLNRILPEFRCSNTVPSWVGNNAWETAFVVNNVVIEQLGLKASDIKCYDDLLRPELKGQIQMPNPASSGTGLLTVAGLLQLHGKDGNGGWDYMAKLHENVHSYPHSGSAPAKNAGSGEVAVGVSFGFPAITQVRNGAPVTVVFPEKGSGWDLEANALIKKDDIKPAAKVFLDWAISNEAMDLYSQNFPIIATGQGGKYEGFPDMNPVDQLIENDLAWIAANRDAILQRWTASFVGA
ncbi:MAG: extracellular solute-binding protein [Oscillospiraceae bacterium]|nr:extracellular solute-binding protein [Oscillospiraceae bacterium]